MDMTFVRSCIGSVRQIQNTHSADDSVFENNLAEKLDACLYGILKKFTGRVYEELLLERGLYPGVGTPDVPDVVDEVDAG